MFELEIPGDPQGKGRLRYRVVRSKNNPLGYASGFTPSKTLKYEDMIRNLARAEWRQAPLENCSVFLHVVAYLSIPKSFSNFKRRAAIREDLRPAKTPDWDNFGKVCSDALNKVVFKDDAQVVDAFVQKFYSENPRIRIVVLPSQGSANYVVKCLESNWFQFRHAA